MHGGILLITCVLIACLGMVLTQTTFMIRTLLAKLNISPIRLHSTSYARIPGSVNNFWNILLTIKLSPLGSPIIGSIINHLMH